MTLEEVLKENNLRTVSLQTIYNWMEALDFKYSPRRKTFYVDGHERPEVVAYRKIHVAKYIEEDFRCFRWIQLTEESVEQLEEDDAEFDKTIGYKYSTADSLTMYEYHVDDHDRFQEFCHMTTTFDGYLSVCMPPNTKPLIKIGQDIKTY